MQVICECTLTHARSVWSQMPETSKCWLGGPVQRLRLTHCEHINFNQSVITYHLLCTCTHKHADCGADTRKHTCSWYSMPIDKVLMRMAIMIPLLKYLLLTIRSSLVCSPAQQRVESLLFGSGNCVSPWQGLLKWHWPLLCPGLLGWHESLCPWCRSWVCSLVFSLSPSCWL